VNRVIAVVAFASGMAAMGMLRPETQAKVMSALGYLVGIGGILIGIGLVVAGVYGLMTEPWDEKLLSGLMVVAGVSMVLTTARLLWRELSKHGD
jgi:undecaprenyl pyrophosphate phosphatase UppP